MDDICDGWTLNADATQLSARILFPSFQDVMLYMAAASVHIVQVNHHPDWANAFDRLEIRLSSHDVGRVTDRDIDLHRQLDALVAGFQGQYL